MTATLRRRTADRFRRSAAARKLRRLRALVSPTGRAQSRRTAMPVRYRWFRLRAIGPVPELIRSIAIPEPDGRPSRLPYDLAVVAGDTELDQAAVDILFECERTSTPTLLIATAPEHLDTELVAVCTDIGTMRQDIYTAAVAKVGVERAHRLPEDPNDTRAWLRALTSLR